LFEPILEPMMAPPDSPAGRDYRETVGPAFDLACSALLEDLHQGADLPRDDRHRCHPRL